MAEGVDFRRLADEKMGRARGALGGMGEAVSTPEGMLGALGMSSVPVISDLAGLASDAIMYSRQPEERTATNYALTGLGALPFVPALSSRFRLPLKNFRSEELLVDMQENPTPKAAQAMARRSPDGYVRGVRNPETGDVYLWSADEAMHTEIADELGLPFRTRNDLQANSILFDEGDVEAEHVQKFLGRR